MQVAHVCRNYTDGEFYIASEPILNFRFVMYMSASMDPKTQWEVNRRWVRSAAVALCGVDATTLMLNEMSWEEMQALVRTVLEYTWYCAYFFFFPTFYNCTWNTTFHGMEIPQDANFYVESRCYDLLC